MQCIELAGEVKEEFPTRGRRLATPPLRVAMRSPLPFPCVPDRPSKILLVQVGTLSFSHPSFGVSVVFIYGHGTDKEFFGVELSLEGRLEDESGKNERWHEGRRRVRAFTCSRGMLHHACGRVIAVTRTACR